MIELVHVTKYYTTELGRHYVFRDVSLALPLHKSVGVIGPNGAGKSTFLRLIAGADAPSDGYIRKSGRISPPMGLTPGLQTSLTGSENARFAGRIHGLDRDEIADMLEHVRDISGIGKFFDLPVSSYSAGMRQRVAFAINMSMQFDYYLFDEIGAGGDREFRKTAKAMIDERLKTSKFIIATHRSDELLDICDAGIVIQKGELTYYENVKDALDAYGGLDDDSGKRGRKRKQAAAAGEPLQSPADFETQTGESLPAAKPSRRDKIARRKELRQAAEKQAAAAAAPVAAAVELSNTVPTKEERRARLKALHEANLANQRQPVMTEAPPVGHAPPAPRRSGAATPAPDLKMPAPAMSDAAVSIAPAPEPVHGVARLQALTRALQAVSSGEPPSADQGGTLATPAQRAARLQERAAMKSAKALYLLLRHLDGIAAGNKPERGRGVVAAAQDSAAADCALARKAMELPVAPAAASGAASQQPAAGQPHSMPQLHLAESIGHRNT